MPKNAEIKDARPPKGSARAGEGAGAVTSGREIGNEVEYYIYDIINLQVGSTFAGVPAWSQLVDLPQQELVPAAALQAARKSVGLTQRELATAIGFTQKTVNDAENGLSRSGPTTISGMRHELERRGARFVRLPEGGMAVVVARVGAGGTPMEVVPRETRPRGRPKSGEDRS